MRQIFLVLLAIQVATAQSALPTPALPREARTVQVSAKSTVPIDTSVLQSTLIVLPEDEKIMTVFGGESSNWVIETPKTAGRFLSVKPKIAGVFTDVHIISDHGNSYSFLFREVSGKSGPSEFDAKVFLEADDSLKPSIAKLPEFVPAADLERFRKEAAHAKAEGEKHQADADKGAEAFRTKYPSTLRFNYKWDAKAAYKMGVQQVYADERFTYIKAAMQETAALYELKEGKPSLVNFDFANGIYTVPKHISRGYLAIGKQKMDFWETAN